MIIVKYGMEDILVSVILPVYNTDKYLNGALESLTNQTFHDFELILVDDGSTDQTASICDEWASKDRRIKVIHQNNQGVSAARVNISFLVMLMTGWNPTILVSCIKQRRKKMQTSYIVIMT